ncbi:unnamed protein product [Caenorhabditis brenneri]
MSDISIGDNKQLMEQSIDDLSKAMEQLTVTADGSNEASKPPKNLEDLTVDVIGLIIEKSDYKQQMNLRKTSRTLRSLVDKHQPALTRLKVSCYYDYIVCHYDDHCVLYIQPNWHHSELIDYTGYRLDSIVSNVNYQQDAFNDLAAALKNPKLQLEYFSFSIDNGGYDSYGLYLYLYGLEFCIDWKSRGDCKRMKNILESNNHKLSVKECRTDISSDIEDIMSFLPYLKPGVLEKITFFMSDLGEDSDRCAENFKRVSLLEQWKQAKELYLEDEGYQTRENTFPTKYATHFKRFHFDECDLDWDMLIWIRDYILKHENAEFCLITDRWCYEKKIFKKLVRRVGTRISRNSSIYTVPDSEYYLEFKHEHESEAIKIEKKKKKILTTVFILSKISEALSSDIQKPMEQSNEDLSEVIGQLSTPPINLSDMPVDVVGLITCSCVKLSNHANELCKKSPDMGTQLTAKTEAKLFERKTELYMNAVDSHIKWLLNQTDLPSNWDPCLPELPVLSQKFQNAYKKVMKSDVPKICETFLKARLEGLGDTECVISTVDMDSYEGTLKCEH